MRKYASAPEALLFGSLKKNIKADLVSNGIPSPLVDALIKWCDPAEEDYLTHVDLWQSLLCLCYTANPDAFPQSFFDFGIIQRQGDTGILTASPYQVNHIHQVVRMLYKFHGQPRKDTDWEAVKTRFRRPGTVNLNEREVVGIRKVLSVLCPPPSWFALTGRFGPGKVTAEGLDRLERWEFKGSFPTQVPFELYDLAFLDELFGKDFSKTPSFHKYGITKVAEVPKSIKTNRFVSSEPAMNMYAQLAVGDYLTDQLHSCFPKEITLNNQFTHRSHLYDRAVRPAYEARAVKGVHTNRHGRRINYEVPYATIDLSDASDHVSRTLVRRLLPNWGKYLFSVRSTFAQFPDGEIVPLRTFAPMGSGVCFPVLTAVCYGIAKYACGDDLVYAYGDDIIVPADKYEVVTDLLVRAGLVVNTAKSSPSGRYREACGCEVYESTLDYACGRFHAPLDITPMMIREPPWKVDSPTLELWCQKLDQLQWSGTRDTLIGMTKSRPLKMRWNDELQRVEVLVRKREPRKIHFENLSGRAGLSRWYSVRSQCDRDAEHQNAPSGDIHIPSSDSVLRTSFEDSRAYPALTSWFITNLQERKDAE